MRRYTILLLVVWLLAAAAPVVADPLPRKTVLVFMPVQPGRPAYDVLLASLLETIQEDGALPPIVFVENLGEPDPSDSASMDAQWTWLTTKYHGRPIDAVVLVGDARTDVRARLGLPPRTPLVYLAGTGAFAPGPIPASTGVLAGEVIRPFVDLVRELLPDTQRIAFVGGGSPADRVVSNIFVARLRAVSHGLPIDDLSGLSLAEIQAKVAALPPKTVIYLGVALVDRENRALTHPILVNALRSVTQAPLFAPIDTAFGHGLVGGVMVSPDDVGVTLGRLVLRVLAGEAPDEIAPREVTPRTMLDWRELKRLDVPASRVPAGAIVIHREPSLWQRNPALVLATTGVVLVQAALIVWLAMEQRRRRRTEAQLAERLRFEAMIHEVSQRLSNLPPDRLDEQMPDVLRTLGQALDVDRCSLRRFVPERRSFALVARWCRSGSHVGIDQEILLEGALHEIERVAGGEAVAVRDVAAMALPPALAEVALRQDTRGVLGMPVRIGDRTIAVLVIATRQPRDWPPHEIIALRPVAEIVGAALVRQQQERESRAQRETLSHLDRVAVLGELASSLAHELNQPLGAILANAEAARLLLAADPPRLKDVRAALDDIVSDDERAGGIIRNMRAMIRRRPPTTENVDVRDAVAGAVRLVQQDALLRRCHIEVRHDASPHTVLCDRIQLQQVVLNLIGNALDASCDRPAIGQVITVETRAESPEIVALSVRDHGPGLGHEIIGRMFEPFFSTKSAGLGVGLTISRSIVETYGGWISAENAEGGGARFTVHLPAGSVAASAARPVGA